MRGRVRLTPVGAVVVVLLAASAIALLLGSRGLQVTGFVVGVLAVLFLAADQLTIRVGWFGLWTQGRTDTSPLGAETPPPEYIERAAEPSDEAWEREQQLYQEKNKSAANSD